MPAPKAAVKSSVAYAVRSKEGIVAALRDARAARLEVPAHDEHARRLLYGFTVPMTLMRVAWGDPQMRRSIWRRLLPPVLCLVVAAGVLVASTSDEGEKQRHGRTVSVDIDDGKADKDDEDDDKADMPPAATLAITEAVTAIARAVPPSPPEPPPPPPPTGRLAKLRAAMHVLTSRAVQVLAGLGIVEWILVWIGREHHDLVAYEASLLTGVPGEPLARPPKLRLDAGWLKLKAWRTIRFLIFLALVSPMAWLLGFIPVVGDALSIVVEGAWAAYWASVFAIANTFVAWEPRPAPGLPWFLRLLARAGRIPLVGIPVRLYARVLTLATRNVWPACEAFEEAPWESAGLALARGVASVPFVYLIFRPMFAPAATHALLGRRPPKVDPPADPPIDAPAPT